MKQLALKALLLSLGLIASLVVLEVAFRSLLARQHSRWSDRPRRYFMPEESPNPQDSKYSQKKPANTFRIIVVGDSFTFGPHLQLEDTFPKRLEHWLNLNQSPRRIEVLNRGYSGFNTVREVNEAKKLLAFEPDLIILQITLNDAEPHSLTREEKELFYGAPWLNNPILKNWRSLRFLLNRVHNSQTHKRYIEYHSKFFEERGTFSVFDSALKDLRTTANSHGVKLAALIFPLFDFPFDRNYPFKKTHQIVQQALESANIPFHDLLSAYSGIPQERLQVIPGGDSHPNEIAHRIAAEQLLNYLLKKSFLPSELSPIRRLRQR